MHYTAGTLHFCLGYHARRGRLLLHAKVPDSIGRIGIFEFDSLNPNFDKFRIVEKSLEGAKKIN